MNQKRIKVLNQTSKSVGKSVVYVMSRDQRSIDNFALLYAKAAADNLKVPVIVVFDLYKTVKNRTKNHFEWMLEGIKEVSIELKKLNIDFYLTFDKSPEELAKLIKENFDPYSIFFDFSPLKGPVYFKENFVNASDSNCYLVDTHNIVPVWEASEKEEFGAYTLRPKLKKLIGEFLSEDCKLTKCEYLFKDKVSSDFTKEINIQDLLKNIKADTLDNYQPLVKPGQSQALKRLEEFINRKLLKYFDLRNNPNFDEQSNLSAYLHFGNLYSFTVVKKVIEYCKQNQIDVNFGFKEAIHNFDSLTEKQKLKLSAESFLEEIITRKELADNYCYYNANYNSLKGIKPWALKTLEEHAKDKRENIYSLVELESAKTNDPAWNAAQIQLLRTGKIHGYMRMYWAKKILEWTESPKDAVEYLIYLNDKYHLDGYDPNGYVGILWSIGGLHDRAWFERPVFGQIRYMNANGLARKFYLTDYVNRWHS